MAETQYRVPPEEAEDDATNGKMGFLEHLDELRTRLIRSCVAIVAGMVVAFAFVDRISDFVLAPTLRMLPARQLSSIRRGAGATGHAASSRACGAA